MTMGYNDLVMIPPGATNIRIAEVDRAFEIKSCNRHTFQLKVKASNNYLALRNQTGHYYLNGNWRIDYPQQFEAAGKLQFTSYWIHVSKIHSSSDPCLNISCTLDPCLKNSLFIGPMSQNLLHIGSMSRSQEQRSTTKESTRTRKLEVLLRFLPRRV